MFKLTTDLIRLPLVLALGIILAGCQTINLETEFVVDAAMHDHILDQNRDAFPEINPLLLTDDMKQFVDGYAGSGTDSTKVKKLQALLFEEQFLNIQYQNLGTETAEGVFNSRTGNCLSVIGLYVALARYLDLDAVFQTVSIQPTWDMRGGLLVLSQHINATGRILGRVRYVVDFTPEVALQQMTSKRITDRQARALYFNNLGVEALITKDMEEALDYFKNALWLDPDLSIAWNNIGTTYNRMELAELAELAEYSYKMSFSIDRSNAIAISNLAKFYDARGDRARGDEYRRAIERFNNRNPYYHYSQGNIAFVSNNYSQALRSFRRALRLENSEPDFHMALARTYARLGNNNSALDFAKSAEELLGNTEIYQPSNQKVRFIDGDTILRIGSPGLSVSRPDRPRSNDE
jgi:Flp pilus assembly protein TadD